MVYEAILGPRARRSDVEWQVDHPEAARLAVSTAMRERVPLSPGFPQPGRVGLRPPEGIYTLWAGELVARVGAGTTVAGLEENLRPHGLALGLEVADPEVTTLGACFADARAGLAGPGGVTLRDRCIGLSFVDGNARLLAAGSRVVKNVAGFDFGRLHHGARGSLGLLLDFTLRLVARPEKRVAVWWACQREEIPRKLPELRASWGNDASSEIWVDRVAAARFALPGEGIVFRQTGRAELLAQRVRKSNAADVSDRWMDLLGASQRPVRPCAATELSVRDPGPDCVVDLGFGLLRSRHESTQKIVTPSRAARAVKRVLDPHGIWPALPGTEVHGR
jgi:hypothetical protein